MNKIKLPSMVEYVKEQDKIDFIAYDNLWEKVINFANFLSQQPNIGMFVPAVFENGEWRVLTEPKEYFEWCKWGDFTKYGKSITPKCKEYHTALNNVIFDGFEVDYSNNEPDNKWVRLKFDKLFITFYEISICVYYPFQDTFIINTIEQLTHYNLTLTPKFAKELGLI